MDYILKKKKTEIKNGNAMPFPGTIAGAYV